MLKQVKTYEEAATAINAVLPQVGATNGIPDRDVLEKEIRRGSLFLQEEDYGLLLLRKRGRWDYLTFLLKRGQSIQLWKPQRPTVAEISFRKDTEPAAQVVQVLQTIGFRPVMKRIRLARKGQETPVFPQDGVGECTDPEASYEILCNCFSTLTGCVPSREEWDELCSRGQVLSLFGGLLHYETKGKITELRHLAVAEDCRRQGLGRYLVGAYLNRCGNSLSRVWTGEENLPARKLYDSLGYASDGWHSVVLYYDTNQKEE